MRDWEEAEQSYKAAAERYRNQAHVWYSYCKRSGRGELHEARNVALAYTDIKGVAEPFWKAVIFMLEKQPKKAISALQSSTYPWDKLLLFTIADESNDYVTRDAAMQAFLKWARNEQKGRKDLPPKEMIAVAEMIAGDLANRQSKIDLKAAETLIEKNERVAQMMCYYYLGKYLDTHGRQADAIALWKKCIGCWMPMDKFARTLAAVELREHGVKEKEIEAALPAENTADEEDKTDDSQKKQEEQGPTNASVRRFNSFFSCVSAGIRSPSASPR